MNWRIEGDATSVEDADLIVDHGDQDDPKAKPDPKLVAAARATALAVAGTLKAKDVHVEVHGHETTKGRGFRPAHLTLSISSLDPKRDTPAPLEVDPTV